MALKPSLSKTPSRVETQRALLARRSTIHQIQPNTYHFEPSPFFLNTSSIPTAAMANFWRKTPKQSEKSKLPSIAPKNGIPDKHLPGHSRRLQRRSQSKRESLASVSDKFGLLQTISLASDLEDLQILRERLKIASQKNRPVTRPEGSKIEHDKNTKGILRQNTVIAIDTTTEEHKRRLKSAKTGKKVTFDINEDQSSEKVENGKLATKEFTYEIIPPSDVNNNTEEEEGEVLRENKDETSKKTKSQDEKAETAKSASVESENEREYLQVDGDVTDGSFRTTPLLSPLPSPAVSPFPSVKGGTSDGANVEESESAQTPCESTPEHTKEIVPKVATLAEWQHEKSFLSDPKIQVNFCDSKKTDQIIQWLNTVSEVQSREGAWTETVIDIENISIDAQS